MELDFALCCFLLADLKFTFSILDRFRDYRMVFLFFGSCWKEVDL